MKCSTIVALCRSLALLELGGNGFRKQHYLEWKIIPGSHGDTPSSSFAIISFQEAWTKVERNEIGKHSKANRLIYRYTWDTHLWMISKTWECVLLGGSALKEYEVPIWGSESLKIWHYDKQVSSFCVAIWASKIYAWPRRPQVLGKNGGQRMQDWQCYFQKEMLTYCWLYYSLRIDMNGMFSMSRYWHSMALLAVVGKEENWFHSAVQGWGMRI